MNKFIILLLFFVLVTPTLAQETEPVIPVINAQSVIAAPVEVRTVERSAGFATALAHSGAVLAVGAPLEMVDTGSGLRYGAVYVYRNLAGTWALEQKIINPTEGHNFGISVAIENGQLAISAWSIGIYFYSFSGATWEISGALLDDDTNENDGFGTFIEWKDNLLAFGDNHMDVRVFRLISGVWTPEATLSGEPTIPFGNLQFGASSAFSDDGAVLAVGEPDAWMFGNTNPRGAVYVYAFNGVSWLLEKKIEEAESPGAFGASVDLLGSGDNVILAASDSGIYASEPLIDESGVAYLYSRSGRLWTKTQQFAASSEIAFDGFGFAVALIGSPENAALIVTSVPNRHPETPLAPARFYMYDVTTGAQIGEVISPSETDFDDDGILDSDGFGRVISLDGIGTSLQIVIGAQGRTPETAKIFVFSHNPLPEELVNSGNFETGSRDFILNAWERTVGAKVKCLSKGNNSPCAVKFVSGIASRIWQDVDLSQIGLFPGDGLLWQADALVKGESSLKMKLKVVYGDGYQVVLTHRINNTGGAYRRVMTAPAIFIANRPLAKISIKINHNILPGAAFLDNVSLVRVAGSSSR
jgi:hypothetical protein